MNDFEQDNQAELPPPVPPVVQHQEPKEGGSYTRDMNTGELVKSEPAPQPEQE
jgi:hypothetical protein